MALQCCDTALVLRWMESHGLNFPHWTVTCHTIATGPIQTAILCLNQVGWFLSVDPNLNQGSISSPRSVPKTFLHVSPAIFCWVKPCLFVMLLRQGKGLLSRLFLKSPQRRSCSRRTSSVSSRTTLFLKSVWPHLPRWAPGTELGCPWTLHGRGALRAQLWRRWQMPMVKFSCYSGLL